MSEQTIPVEEPVADDAQEFAVPEEGYMKEGAALHVDKYEGMWLKISFVVMGVFFLSVIVSAFAIGIQLPGSYARIDPNTLYEPGSPYAEPGLRELAPGKYEAYFRAQIWSFAPNEIRVPAGSEVTFYVTSQDVQHGFKITQTNVNVMVLPGQVSTLKHTFNEPGEYQIICHEYCGQLHHTMYATIYVEGEGEAEEEAATGGQS